MTDAIAAPRHQLSRVRRETRRRALTVTALEQLSPHMLRVHLAGEALADFESSAPDDHVKLFVPDGAGGEARRDYTPRAFDTAAQTLVIDFALHEAGPATRWALDAQIGDAVEIGGPRGSTIVPDDYDWYLLVGDETALPAIARRIEELRADVPVTAIIAVDEVADQLPLPDRAGLRVAWSPRAGASEDDATRLVAAITREGLPKGEGFVWIAAEAQVARTVRAHVVEGLGHPREWLKASGYWTSGTAGAHDKIGD